MAFDSVTECDRRNGTWRILLKSVSSIHHVNVAAARTTPSCQSREHRHAARSPEVLLTEKPNPTRATHDVVGA